MFGEHLAVTVLVASRLVLRGKKFVAPKFMLVADTLHCGSNLALTLKLPVEDAADAGTKANSRPKRTNGILRCFTISLIFQRELHFDAGLNSKHPTQLRNSHSLG